MVVLDILKNIISFLIGSSTDLGKANRVAGVVNYAWALPALGWVWYHRAENIAVQVVLYHGDKPEVLTLFTTTYFGLSAVIVGLFAWAEFGRRAP